MDSMFWLFKQLVGVVLAIGGVVLALVVGYFLLKLLLRGLVLAAGSVMAAPAVLYALTVSKLTGKPYRPLESAAERESRRRKELGYDK